MNQPPAPGEVPRSPLGSALRRAFGRLPPLARAFVVVIGGMFVFWAVVIVLVYGFIAFKRSPLAEQLAGVYRDPLTQEFMGRHPHLTLSTYPIDSVLADREGRTVELSEGDLWFSRFAFEPCDGAPGADRFGGMPPPPGWRCVLRYRLTTRFADGEQVRVVYQLRTEATPPEVASGPEAHFESWAGSIGAEHRSWSSGGKRSTGTFEASLGDRRWNLRFVRRRHSVDLYMPEGGFTPE